MLGMETVLHKLKKGRLTGAEHMALLELFQTMRDERAAQGLGASELLGVQVPVPCPGAAEGASLPKQRSRRPAMTLRVSQRPVGGPWSRAVRLPLVGSEFHRLEGAAMWVLGNRAQRTVQNGAGGVMSALGGAQLGVMCD
ncbi:MAG: hypothetical protein ACUVWA_03295 [Candidatus Oleimicrobiaceae bacterium]